MHLFEKTQIKLIVWKIFTVMVMVLTRKHSTNSLHINRGFIRKI